MSSLPYNWSVESLLEISIDDPDAFLKIKETLTRIGVASKRDNTLFQTCHILHKRGRYYIVMFKELFLLDGRTSDITEEDIARRNTIASLLEQWGLCKILNKSEYFKKSLQTLTSIKIVSYREKRDWNLQSKYCLRGERTPK